MHWKDSLRRAQRQHYRDDGKPKKCYNSFQYATNLAYLKTLKTGIEIQAYICFCGAAHIGRPSKKPHKIYDEFLHIELGERVVWHLFKRNR